MQPALVDVDPFDLPDWLGTQDVVWRADGGLSSGHHVPGRLTGEGQEELACDLLAVDEAYPVPVVDDASRLRVHQAWRHGQVLLGEHDGRLAIAAPGAAWTPERVLDALDRLSRAVGARPERFAAMLRIGG